MIRKVNFKEAKDLIDNKKDLVLIDVRDEEEYITGHAEGAVLLPVSEMDGDSLLDLVPDTDTPVMVYCRSGMRSARAALILDESGYEEIYDIGSLAGWHYGLEY